MTKGEGGAEVEQLESIVCCDGFCEVVSLSLNWKVSEMKEMNAL